MSAAWSARVSSQSMRGPTAIDGQRRAGDRGCRVAGEKHRQRAELFDGRKALVWLLGQKDVANDLLAGNAVRFRLAIDLGFDEGAYTRIRGRWRCR